MDKWTFFQDPTNPYRILYGTGPGRHVVAMDIDPDTELHPEFRAKIASAIEAPLKALADSEFKQATF